MTPKQIRLCFDDPSMDEDELETILNEIDKIYGELEMWKVWAEKVTKTEGLNPVLYRSLIETMIKR